MNVVAMKFKKPELRMFYRCYILPGHIAKRKGENKKALEQELAEHQSKIKALGLEDALASYVDAQKARQAAYDEWQLAKSVNADNVEMLGAKFAKLKKDFAETYH